MREIFEQYSVEMKNEFQRLSKLAPSEIRGRIREIIISKFLERCLPKSIGIGHGWIISSDGKRSDEIDVILYDSLKCPIYHVGDFQMIPAEGVYIVIEIESKLDSEDLVKKVKKIKEVKNLLKLAFYEQKGDITKKVDIYGKEFEYFPTIGTIFAFDSTDLNKLTNELEKVNRQLKLSLEEQIDVICVFEKGMIFHYNPKKHAIEFPPVPECELRFHTYGPEQNLLRFYDLLMHVLTQAWVRPIDTTTYLRQFFR